MKLKKLILVVYSMLAVLAITLLILTQFQYNDTVHKILTKITSQIQDLQYNRKEIDTQHILNSSVMISDIKGMGSGTAIKATDNAMYILTCHHVVKNTIELNYIIDDEWKMGVTVSYIKLDDNYEIISRVMHGAEIVEYDVGVDLALLKIYIVDENLRVVNIAENNPKKGDTIYTVGNPLGMIRTISKGILANVKDIYYIFDGTITYGNSGGGLYNIDNELVGVPSQVYVYGNDFFGTRPESSLGFSINLPTIKDFLEGIDYE